MVYAFIRIIFTNVGQVSKIGWKLAKILNWFLILILLNIIECATLFETHPLIFIG